MHDGEVETDVGLVRRLLADQFPQWAGLPIRPVESYGTDHDIYRLGDDLSARLPRINWATAQAAREATWLPRLAPHVPLEVPVQLAMATRNGVLVRAFASRGWAWGGRWSSPDYQHFSTTGR